ncbi:RNA polymerase-binding protein DksA [Candidatus Accumulibacter sp. ACC003]|uniref:RNA polymerase-binding protein DksA n=1 Tax=Candidatus Accumulibacter sp. ACC003 TaxID=2823334 RepID=UPI0025C3A8E9|nr:RNA polymerase-binding protein DksA [Candidatus Accumulibacter sp. ACC003]
MTDELAYKHFTPYAPTAGEEYMNSAQLDHFRSILEALKQQLVVDIERTVHTMKDEATNFADPNDRASQETDIAIELRNRDRERKLIKKIEETMDLIGSGDYGYCAACGVEIGIKRLEARPTATMCIDCKTLEEVREKQIAK